MRYFFASLLVFVAAIGGGYCFSLFAEQMERHSLLSNAIPVQTPIDDAKENEAPDAGFRIVVNLASRILTLYENGIKTRLYPVAVGKEWTPTPTGRFVVEEKQEDPAWADPKREEIVVPPGENNPLGTRWMGIGGYYGIHGTNAPSSIGDYMSNGCIRMFDEDAQELFSIVPTGARVEIIYQRIVVEKQADGTVVFYCYPDGYGWQEVGVKDAMEALRGYGVQDFADPDVIAAYIEASAGEPLLIAKSYPVRTSGVGDTKETDGAEGANGTDLNFFAVQEGEDIYLPAIPLFHAFQMHWEWNAEQQTITTGRRVVPGAQKGAGIYLKAEHLEKALHLGGELTEAGQFELTMGKLKPQKGTAEQVPPRQSHDLT